MFFYDTRPKFWLFSTKIKVDGVNFGEALPVSVRVAVELFKLMFEMYLILISRVDLLSITNSWSFSMT
jgi:hypothetical protein